MKLYHYTTVETLALILKNKTIRFNRLDKVDDLEEAMYPSGSGNAHLGQYAFVTCWTKSEKEDICMWNMYTNSRGVRIGLDEGMFPKLMYMKSKPCLYSNNPFNFQGKRFTSCLLNEYRLIDIKYVDSVNEKVSELVKVEGNKLNITTSEVGVYKNQQWSFQNECRYRLIFFPIDPKLVENKNVKPKKEELIKYLIDLISTLNPLVLANKPLDISYVDVPLDEEKLKHIEVVMGPLASEGEKEIVRKLLQEYPESTLRDSYSKGKLRR